MSNRNRHIVIVGGGLSGIVAAIEAATTTSAHVRITLVEQEASLTSCNSAKASSGLNAAPTPAQHAQGINDSVAYFFADTLKSGRGEEQQELAQVLCSESADALAYLERHGGLDMSVVTLMGGHSQPRSHRAKITGRPVNVGLAIVSAMERALRQLGNVDIRLNTQMRDLLLTPLGEVRGVRLLEVTTNNTLDLEATAVVLATGGFSADREGLLKEYQPRLTSMPSTNAPWRSVGEGIRAAQRAGAGLRLMDRVQVHPTGLVDPKQPQSNFVILAGESLRGSGGILLNAQGRRFCNELDYRDRVSAALFSHGSFLHVAGGLTPSAAYLVLNNAAASKFEEGVAFYTFKGLVMGTYPTLAAFCSAANIPIETARETFARYNEAAQNGMDEFGKTAFPSVPLLDSEQLTVLIVTPAVHYTMGGVHIDVNASVLHAESNKPIPGLFAAGEVTGGLHGANRLGGNSLLECVVFGRRAGRSACSWHN